MSPAPVRLVPDPGPRAHLDIENQYLSLQVQTQNLILTFLCILDRFFFFSLLFMNFFFGAVSSMSFFISTSFILRLSRVLSTWGGGQYLTFLHQSVGGGVQCVIQVCLICYLRPDVVVEALDEAGDDPHCGQ